LEWSILSIFCAIDQRAVVDVAVFGLFFMFDNSNMARIGRFAVELKPPVVAAPQNPGTVFNSRIDGQSNERAN
jgi:hypothetical protein